MIRKSLKISSLFVILQLIGCGSDYDIARRKNELLAASPVKASKLFEASQVKRNLYVGFRESEVRSQFGVPASESLVAGDEFSKNTRMAGRIAKQMIYGKNVHTFWLVKIKGEWVVFADQHAPTAAGIQY